jgi:hypothetical protein
MDTEILKDEVNKRIDEALKDCPGAGVCRGMIRGKILAYWSEYRVLPELRIEKRSVIGSPSPFPPRANQDILVQASPIADPDEQPTTHILSTQLYAFP